MYRLFNCSHGAAADCCKSNLAEAVNDVVCSSWSCDAQGEEAIRAQKQAAVAQQAAEGAQQRETELRAEVRDLAERARRAEVSAAEKDAYAQSLRYAWRLLSFD